MPVCIDSGGRLLIGMLHRPESADARRAVVVLVGGPQYRVGSHRQFVLLARELCRRGIAVLRFDFSGMGDSDGEHRASSMPTTTSVPRSTVCSRCSRRFARFACGACVTRPPQR